jgi:integrase
LEDFRKSLELGNTRAYAKITCSRIKTVLDGCGICYWSDMSASKTHRYISELRKQVTVVDFREVGKKKVKVKKTKDLGEISAKTKNYYLAAIKQFCRWMIKDQREDKSPIEHLGRLTVPDDEYRRALSFDEAGTLLETTEKAPKRFGMSGHERAVLYLMTVETGLRVQELHSLKVSSFDFENCTVSVESEYCKDRKRAVQLLKNNRASQLREYLSNKTPGTKAFNMPSNYRTVAMLKADLAEARIPYEAETGRADFHCSRHTLAPALDKTGASLKERMTIMRHSDKSNLTLGT